MRKLLLSIILSIPLYCFSQENPGIHYTYSWLTFENDIFDVSNGQPMNVIGMHIENKVVSKLHFRVDINYGLPVSDFITTTGFQELTFSMLQIKPQYIQGLTKNEGRFDAYWKFGYALTVSNLGGMEFDQTKVQRRLLYGIPEMGLGIEYRPNDHLQLYLEATASPFTMTLRQPEASQYLTVKSAYNFVSAGLSLGL